MDVAWAMAMLRGLTTYLRFFRTGLLLGHWCFFFHDWNAPPNLAIEAEIRFHRTSTKWNKLKSQPLPEDLENLKNDLMFFDYQGWTVCPATIFADELALFKKQERMDTIGGATGSPKPMGNG